MIDTLRISQIVKEFGWEENDDVVIEIGGTAITGTATHADANPKWAKPFGTVSHQKDAFIIIKNKTRNKVVSSQPNPELKQHHT